jgi:glycosyltransferase involved in cell wall biosynthesis
MRIVFELDGCPDLGLSRAIDIIKTASENPRLFEVYVVWRNNSWKDSLALRKILEVFLPSSQIHVWEAHGPTQIDTVKLSNGLSLRNLMRIEVLLSLKPDSVHSFDSLEKGLAPPDFSVARGGSIELSATVSELFAPQSFEGLVQDHDAWRESDDTSNLEPVLEKIVSQGEAFRRSLSQEYLVPSRPTVAVVSVVEPTPTGIATYTSNLLPYLRKFWKISVVRVTPPGEEAGKERCDGYLMPEWFLENWKGFDMVLYMLGNSHHNHEAVELLSRVPGVVVFHDTNLEGYYGWLAAHLQNPDLLTNRVWDTEGIRSVIKLGGAPRELAEVATALPPLKNAVGAIVHSNFAKAQLEKVAPLPVRKIAFPTMPPRENLRKAARARLALEEDVFLICSFGFIGPNKRSFELLEAFEASLVSRNRQTRLVFVGEFGGREFGTQFGHKVKKLSSRTLISQTGFVDRITYDDYLASCDVAVQLRMNSRGETSAAVMDCLSAGIPTIVNAHGSFAEIEPSIVMKLPEDLSVAELTYALDEVGQMDQDTRSRLGASAKAWVEQGHSYSSVAGEFDDALREMYQQRGQHSIPRFLSEISSRGLIPEEKMEQEMLAVALGRSLPPKRLKPMIYLEVSATAATPRVTGVERVVMELTRELTAFDSENYGVQPVRLSIENGEPVFQTAKEYLLAGVWGVANNFTENFIDLYQGDVLVFCDINSGVVNTLTSASTLDQLRARGVKVFTIVYDLLPVEVPDVFPPGADGQFREWLENILELDGALCISETTASRLSRFRNRLKGDDYASPFSIRSFPLGHLQREVSEGNCTSQVIRRHAKLPRFLMVGTIEPRKAHLAVLRAFEKLWDEGYSFGLTVVGREGWVDVPEGSRRTIPETVKVLRRLNLRQRHFRWLDDANDEELGQQYLEADCLIAASLDEGFGLPLVEAASAGLSLFAHDIEIFREVAGDSAYYFDSLDPDRLSRKILDWSELWQNSRHPRAQSLSLVSWSQSAHVFFNHLVTMAKDK